MTTSRSAQAEGQRVIRAIEARASLGAKATSPSRIHPAALQPTQLVEAALLSGKEPACSLEIRLPVPLRIITDLQRQPHELLFVDRDSH